MLDFKRPTFWTRKCRLNFYLVSKWKFENSQKIGFREKVKIYLWTATSGILGLVPRVGNPLPEVAWVCQSCSVGFCYSWLFSVLGVGHLHEALFLDPFTKLPWLTSLSPAPCGVAQSEGFNPSPATVEPSGTVWFLAAWLWGVMQGLSPVTCAALLCRWCSHQKSQGSRAVSLRFLCPP